MDPPGSCVRGIPQARITEWIAIFFSRGSSWPRDQTPVPCLAGGFFTPEPLGSSSLREEEDNKEMAWTESVMASVHMCMYIQARSTSTEQSRVQYSVLILTPPGPVLYLLSGFSREMQRFIVKNWPTPWWRLRNLTGDWRPGKPVVWFQSWVQRPEIQAAWEVNPCPKAEDLWPSPVGRQEAKGANFLYILLYSGPWGIGWGSYPPCPRIGEGELLYLLLSPLIQMLISSQTLLDTPRNHTESWRTLAVKSTYKINHQKHAWCFPGGSGGSEIKNLPIMQETWFNPWAGKIPWRTE